MRANRPKASNAFMGLHTKMVLRIRAAKIAVNSRTLRIIHPRTINPHWYLGSPMMSWLQNAIVVAVLETMTGIIISTG